MQVDETIILRQDQIEIRQDSATGTTNNNLQNILLNKL